jgi:hypothetical protein
MVAVWLRNTGLNMIVLISTFLTALLLPHLLQTRQVSTVVGGWLENLGVLPWIAFGLLAVAAAWLWRSVRTVNERFSQVGSADAGPILARVLLPIVVAVVAMSASIYKASTPNPTGDVYSGHSNQVFSGPAPAALHLKTETASADGYSVTLLNLSRDNVISRIRLGWKYHPDGDKLKHNPAAQWFSGGVGVLVLSVATVLIPWGNWRKLLKSALAGKLVWRLVFALMISIGCAGLAMLLVWGVELTTFLGFSSAPRTARSSWERCWCHCYC